MTKPTLEEIEKFIRELRPLDMLLVRGTSLYSQLISNGSELIRGEGDASHCAIIVNKKICRKIKADVNDDELLTMESTLSEIDGLDIETQRVTFGTQFRNLKSVVISYIEKGYSVGVVKLKENPYVNAKTDEDLLKLQNIFDKIYDTYYGVNKAYYTINLIELLATIIPSLRGLRKKSNDFIKRVLNDNEWIFCSELCAIVYQELGLIKMEDGETPEDYLPVDFFNPSDQDKVDSIMILPPVWLYNPNSPTKESAIKWFLTKISLLFKVIYQFFKFLMG